MYDETAAQEIAELSGLEPLTNFESVNTGTDLGTLNLNWREKDLPEKLRTKHVHRLHPYMGKFIPQIVEIFLRKFRPQLVYDPFCGSGTTLVEANALGIDSVGTDISAFNVLLSRVKTDSYDLGLLDKECRDILTRLSERTERVDGARGGLVSRKDFEGMAGVPIVESEYLDTWFADRAKRELLCYLDLIASYRYQKFLKVILSRSARSARMVKHYDLDFPKRPQTEPYTCHKHGRTCEPVREARKFLVRYTMDSLKRVAEFERMSTDATVLVNHADSREVELPKGIDLVFTSPPYIGRIDYHEQHRYAYELLGLENNEGYEIGAAKRGLSDRARKEYVEGINDTLLHTRDHMADAGTLIIVVNDKNNLYNPMDVGFRSVGRVERQVNRRTGRRSGTFHESILIWRKR